MKNKNMNLLVKNALIAAIYAVVSLVFAPISFGYIQCRLSEALTLLPVIMPSSVIGITLGCAITNLVGAATGANFLGFVDVFLGSAATLIAGFMSYKLRNVRFKGLPLLSALPPIILNGVVVGAEWCYVVMGGFPILPLLTLIFFVAAGEAVSCLLIGAPLIKLLEKHNVDKVINK